MARGQSKSTLELMDRVTEVTSVLRNYWPLTLRQIYYRLVAKEYLENSRNRYQALSKVCTQMRLNGSLSWAVMEDRTRTVSGKRGRSSMADFIRSELKYFLKGYTRCLVQQQENYVELWVEKDALYRIFSNVAYPYCVRTVCCKGQVSTTFIRDYAKRAEATIAQGKNPVIVYGGDLDPTGWHIPISIKQRLEEQHGIHVTLDRFALNPEQVNSYNLPHNPDALKWSDSKAKKYVQQFGEMAVELDALEPPVLETEIIDALRRHLDFSAMALEREVERKEHNHLSELRRKIIGMVETEELI